jgi:hypothetical protein
MHECALLSVPESGRNPAPGDVLLAFDAFSVDAEQDFHSMAGPLGDLRRRYSPVEPGGEARMTQVIGSAGER